MSRYDATIRTVQPWPAPVGERQDIVRVIADLNYSHGAMWWLEDETTGTKPGDQYTITVERRIQATGSGGTPKEEK